jgi:TPR repeat protein
MYHLGRGVPQNDKEAVKWYRKAAEHGHAKAQYGLGMVLAGMHAGVHSTARIGISSATQKTYEVRDSI